LFHFFELAELFLTNRCPTSWWTSNLSELV